MERLGLSDDVLDELSGEVDHVVHLAALYDMTADAADNEEAKRRLLGEKQPSLQFTTPEQLGDLAVFLCSSGADNVRGQAWAVDGGWTAQ